MEQRYGQSLGKRASRARARVGHEAEGNQAGRGAGGGDLLTSQFC